MVPSQTIGGRSHANALACRTKKNNSAERHRPHPTPRGAPRPRKITVQPCQLDPCTLLFCGICRTFSRGDRCQSLPFPPPPDLLFFVARAILPLLVLLTRHHISKQGGFHSSEDHHTPNLVLLRRPQPRRSQQSVSTQPISYTDFPSLDQHFECLSRGRSSTTDRFPWENSRALCAVHILCSLLLDIRLYLKRSSAHHKSTSVSSRLSPSQRPKPFKT